MLASGGGSSFYILRYASPETIKWDTRAKRVGYVTNLNASVVSSMHQGKLMEYIIRNCPKQLDVLTRWVSWSCNPFVVARRIICSGCGNA